MDRARRHLELLVEAARHLPEGTDAEVLFDVIGRRLQQTLGEPTVGVRLVAEQALGPVAQAGPHVEVDLAGAEVQDEVAVEVALRGVEVEGTLTVTGQRGTFEEEARALLQPLADLLSGVLCQQMLFDHVLRTNTALARLDDISRDLNTAREVETIVGVAAAGLADLVDADGLGLYVLAEGLPTLLAWHGEPDAFPQTVAVVGGGGRVLVGKEGATAVPLGGGELAGRRVLVELLRGGEGAALGLIVIRLGADAPSVGAESRALISALAGHLAVAVHNARLLAEMRRYATFDDLTGLAGRRHFLNELQREIDRAKRDGRPLSLLMVDADHFKAINDGYGHLAGDEVLKAMSIALVDGTRSLDVVGRLGGEEFGVLLPTASEELAMMVAERLRASVEAVAVPWRDGVLRVTVSVGVAAWSEPMSPDDLVGLADEALYVAKDQGRNRVIARTSLETVEWTGGAPVIQDLDL